MLAVVHRFVGADPPLTAALPVATIDDDTRFALAAPREQPVVWPKFLPPHEGPRLVKLRQLLPPGLEAAPRLLVFAHARIGQEWTARPPEIVTPIRGRQNATVEL